MRFQPSTLKQASSGPSSQLWVDCCEAHPCPLGSQRAGSSPATSVASWLSHATADGHSLTPGGSFSSVLHPPHDHRGSLKVINTYEEYLAFFSAPPLFLWMSLSAMLNRNHTRNGVLRLLLGHWLPSPPHPLWLYFPEISRLAATLFINLADTFASSARLACILCWAPPCLPHLPC